MSLPRRQHTCTASATGQRGTDIMPRHTYSTGKHRRKKVGGKYKKGSTILRKRYYHFPEKVGGNLLNVRRRIPLSRKCLIVNKETMNKTLRQQT